MLTRAPVYRNIELRQSFVGLEPLEWVALGFVLLVLRVVNPHALGWHLLLLICALFGLRLLKRGRPEGYTTMLIRFYLRRRPFFSSTARDREAAPFPGSIQRGTFPSPLRKHGLAEPPPTTRFPRGNQVSLEDEV